ncbi:tyrosine-type recombinase/integrase [Planctomycetota bacterium]
MNTKVERQQWSLDEQKFLTVEEIRLLKNKIRKRADKYPDRHSYVNDWFLVDLALSTGLRVQEIRDICCGDLFVGEESFVFVRNGKGGKQRSVRFNGEFKKHVIKYFDWKKYIGEDCAPSAPLFVSRVTGGHLNKRSLQKAFERCVRMAGIGRHHSIHHLRHTYACYLYKASKYNLRVVQKQLGHASIVTTQVYADVVDKDLEQALERLYK